MTKQVGIVGAGGISRLHARACRAEEGFELAAVCDVSPEAASRFGEEFDVACRCGSVAEMTAAVDLDIAIVTTWGVHHAEVGIALAESRRVRAILCEKPFTSNAEEAARLVDAARRNGVLIAEAFKFRHHPMHLKADELIDSGALGDVTVVRSTFSSAADTANLRPEDNWRWNRSKGGGSIYDLACYNIHHARRAFRAEPIRVFAAEQRGREVDVAAFLLLEFPGGRAAHLSVGWTSWHSQYGEVSGTKGALRMDAIWNNEHQPTALEFHHAGGVERFAFEPVDPFALQLRHMAECLDTGQPHRIPPENSVAQMRVLDAAFKSMATGKAVDVIPA